MVLTLESADEILCCDDSNETSWILHLCSRFFFLKRSLEILLNYDLCHFSGGRVKYSVILIFWQKDEQFKCFDVDWIKEVMGRRSWIAKETKGNHFRSRSQGRLGGTSSKHR